MHPHETSTRVGNSPPPPSSIASSMPVSRIREIMELAWKDPEAIHLEVGEPDFPTPEHAVDRPTGNAVERERELEREDVGAARADFEHA